MYASQSEIPSSLAKTGSNRRCVGRPRSVDPAVFLMVRTHTKKNLYELFETLGIPENRWTDTISEVIDQYILEQNTVERQESFIMQREAKIRAELDMVLQKKEALAQMKERQKLLESYDRFKDNGYQAELQKIVDYLSRPSMQEFVYSLLPEKAKELVRSFPLVKQSEAIADIYGKITRQTDYNQEAGDCGQ